MNGLIRQNFRLVNIKKVSELSRLGAFASITNLPIFEKSIRTFSSSPNQTLSEHQVEDLLLYRKELEELKQKHRKNFKTKRTKVGIVTSTKMDRSVVVTVFYKWLHPKYRVNIKRKSKIMAHDEHEMCSEGDIVRIGKCRPISKRKHHSIIDILKKQERL